MELKPDWTEMTKHLIGFTARPDNHLIQENVYVLSPDSQLPWLLMFTQKTVSEPV